MNKRSFTVRAIYAGGENWFAQKDVVAYLYRSVAYSGSEEIRAIAAELEHPTSMSDGSPGSPYQRHVRHVDIECDKESGHCYDPNHLEVVDSSEHGE
jgi:hypothetical protein